MNETLYMRLLMALAMRTEGKMSIGFEELRQIDTGHVRIEVRRADILASYEIEVSRPPATPNS